MVVHGPLWCGVNTVIGWLRLVLRQPAQYCYVITRIYGSGHHARIARSALDFYHAVICIGRTMPSLDVRLSHACILSKSLNITIKFFSPSGSQPFPYQKVGQYIVRGSQRGRRGYKISQFSTNISLYLGNDTGELHLQWTSYRKSYSNGSIFTDLEWLS